MADVRLESVPPHVQEWIRQLLDMDPGVLSQPQIEVRLYANGGKVRKRPMVVLNGGSSEMVDVDG